MPTSADGSEALNENGKSASTDVSEHDKGTCPQGNIGILRILRLQINPAEGHHLNERRHELAMEGLRFWDLVRTGRAPAVLGPLGFVTGKMKYYRFLKVKLISRRERWCKIQIINIY